MVSGCTAVNEMASSACAWIRQYRLITLSVVNHPTSDAGDCLQLKLNCYLLSAAMLLILFLSCIINETAQRADAAATDLTDRCM